MLLVKNEQKPFVGHHCPTRVNAMQAFARALIFRAPGLFAPHAYAARVSIVPRRLTRDLSANAGGWSIGPGGRVGGGQSGGGRDSPRDARDDNLRRNRFGDEY